MGPKEIKSSKHIYLLDIPVDIIPLENLETKIKEMLSDNGVHQIVFINTLDLLKARRNAEYEQCLRNASLVISTSKGIIRGAKFVKKIDVVRHMPFEFVIRLLGALENQNQSLYLLGQKQQELTTIENNLRTSFPKLRIVGRYVGYFPRELQSDIITAIKKASPSLLLVGRGLPGKDMWVYSMRKHLNPGISLWCSECFDIFSGRTERISKTAWESGTYKISGLFRRPWRFLRIFIYFYYNVLLLIYRIKEK
jgi:N-acetylglucosaminyldiphosphoundecaprenol N-acetyl-beta-D-mannosaminyltransferase